MSMDVKGCWVDNPCSIRMIKDNWRYLRSAMQLRFPSIVGLIKHQYEDSLM